jgi:hypothetical protein
MKYKLSKENKIALLRVLQTGEIDSETLPIELQGEQWKVTVIDNQQQLNNLSREEIESEIRRLTRINMNGDLKAWTDYLDDCFDSALNTFITPELYKQMVETRQKLYRYQDYLSDKIERYRQNYSV